MNEVVEIWNCSVTVTGVYECIPLLHFHDNCTLHRSPCAVQSSRWGCSICSISSNKYINILSCVRGEHKPACCD